MSSHRAYINCMRCYDLSDEISREENKLAQLRLKQDRHYARNEATAALEDGSLVAPWKERYRRGWYTALNACVTCDFSKPSMAALLEENDIGLQKALTSPEPVEKPHNYRTNAKPE